MEDFLADRQGRQFRDFVTQDRRRFRRWLAFFNDESRQVRMERSELDHRRPPLAGVVVELESHADFRDYLAGRDGHETARGRQVIGVIVRILMEMREWRRTGRKGSLGQRVRVPPGTPTPGAYRNQSGLSTWFTKAERYDPPADLRYGQGDDRPEAPSTRGRSRGRG